MEALYRQITRELRAACGIDLSGYRESTLHRRVDTRIAAVSPGDPERYLQHLRGNQAECARLIEAIAINVSSFFRDPMVYEALAQDVLPEILERKGAQGAKEVRIWSVGCATGEEPYSVAILLDQALKKQRPDWSCLIFATDIVQADLERAREGVYERDRLSEAKLGLVDRYFTPAGQGFKLCDGIKEMVHFSWGNLGDPEHAIPSGSIFGSFDLVLCRNVLIYFTGEAQAVAFQQLNHALAPGGYLVLGSTEALGPELEGRLRVVSRRDRMFRKLPQGRGNQ